MLRFAFTNVWLFILFSTTVYSLYLCLDLSPLTACNNVNLFITHIQDKHLLVSDILESLIALSTFFFFWLPYVFLYFSAFWKKNPAEGRVLSCDIWTKKRLCGVFNLSCLIVTHFLWRCCMHMPFFGRKVH